MSKLRGYSTSHPPPHPLPKLRFKISVPWLQSPLNAKSRRRHRSTSAPDSSATRRRAPVTQMVSIHTRGSAHVTTIAHKRNRFFMQHRNTVTQNRSKKRSEGVRESGMRSSWRAPREPKSQRRAANRERLVRGFVR